MKYDPEIHHRRSIRLKNYDYSQAGAYFITICTQNKECLLGKITDMAMVLNEYGTIVKNEWIKLPDHYPNIELDVFQIMPNHIHVIIIVGATLAVAQNMVAQNMVAQNMVAQNMVAQNAVVENNNTRAGANRAGANRAGASPAPTGEMVAVGNVIGAFKSLVSNEILKLYKMQNKYMGKFWQRNYYEHIIRDETELNNIREYIVNNPLTWQSDENYRD